jgi:hypothetical protein
LVARVGGAEALAGLRIDADGVYQAHSDAQKEYEFGWIQSIVV